MDDELDDETITAAWRELKADVRAVFEGAIDAVGPERLARMLACAVFLHLLVGLVVIAAAMAELAGA